MREAANPPDRLTTTRSIVSPAISSAAWTALRIESPAASRSTIVPPRTPRDDLMADAEDARLVASTRRDKAADLGACRYRARRSGCRAAAPPAGRARGRAPPLSPVAVAPPHGRSCAFARRSLMCSSPAGAAFSPAALPSAAGSLTRSTSRSGSRISTVCTSRFSSRFGAFELRPAGPGAGGVVLRQHHVDRIVDTQVPAPVADPHRGA